MRKTVMGLLALSVIMVLVIAAVVPTSAFAKGLKVYLTVDSNRFVGETSVRTHQFGDRVYTHEAVIEEGRTELTLNYPKDTVEVGDFKICIEGNCGDGYNSPKKEPEDVYVDISRTYDDDVDEGQAQSQSQSQSQEQSQSQSQSQTIIINGEVILR